jgi:hypothetical protein
MEKDIVQTENYKGYTINIVNDYDSENPLREWDNIGTAVCFHSRYDLGSNHDFSDVDELQDFLKSTPHLALNLYLYYHSGITMRTEPFSCRWDSGQVGVIYITFEEIRKEFKIKNVTKKWKEKIYGYMKGTIETYDQYLRGDVYGYQISKEDTDDITDSCYGYFGDDHSYIIDEAKSIIDYYAKEEEKIQKELNATYYLRLAKFYQRQQQLQGGKL